MKNALLKYYTNTKINIFNIGDYIQSLAAAQFFDNKIDILLDREHLNEYSGDKVKLIMNGWFMHYPQNWPPSTQIHPLFVAFHLNSSVKEYLLAPDNVAYFKKHEPIGCRDWNSVKLLQSQNVKAYFSGCLTLTLGLSYQNRGGGSNVYFTDVFYKTNKRFRDLISVSFFGLTHIWKMVKLCKIQHKPLTLKNIIRTSSFYNVYSNLFTDDVLFQAQYMEHEIEDNFENEEQKFAYAKSLLSMYSHAKFVVTSRIHCALPCLAMNTPVLYIENVSQPEISSCRLNGLRELFHVVEYRDGELHCNILNGKLSNNTIFSNKKNYESYRDKLIETCNSFIKS